MTKTEVFISLLTDFLMLGVSSLTSIQGSDTLLLALLELINKGISLLGAFDEDDALVDLAGL